MKVIILDKRVKRNLELFRHLIHRQAEKSNRFFQVAKKSYNAFINRKTGELKFAELDRKKTPLGDEWKPIVIQLRPNEEGAFEVLSAESSEVFDCSQISKEAYALLSKTIHILNQLSYDPKQGKNPFWILRQISHLEFLLSEEEEGQRNLIHDAWHNINREEAEYLLETRTPGTYLFRKDEFAKLLEDTLNEESAEPVVCITLTYRDWDDKICDRTLVNQDGRWQFYNDDPGLCGARYDNVKDLLNTIRDQISEPLLAA